MGEAGQWRLSWGAQLLPAAPIVRAGLHFWACRRPISMGCGQEQGVERRKNLDCRQKWKAGPWGCLWFVGICLALEGCCGVPRWGKRAGVERVGQALLAQAIRHPLARLPGWQYSSLAREPSSRSGRRAGGAIKGEARAPVRTPGFLSERPASPSGLGHWLALPAPPLQHPQSPVHGLPDIEHHCGQWQGHHPFPVPPPTWPTRAGYASGTQQSLCVGSCQAFHPGALLSQGSPGTVVSF